MRAVMSPCLPTSRSMTSKRRPRAWATLRCPRDLRGERFDLILQPLDHVGLALDDGFKKTDHDLYAAAAIFVAAAGALRKDLKGPRFAVADGDQARASPGMR